MPGSTPWVTAFSRGAGACERCRGDAEGLTFEDATLPRCGHRRLVWPAGRVDWRGKVEVNRLDFDRVMARLAAPAPTGGDWPIGGGHAGAGRAPGSWRSPAALTARATLRDVGGRLTVADGRLGIADLRMLTPGDTLVTGAAVRGVGDDRRVEGQVKVVSGGLRDALRWLGLAPELGRRPPA